MEKTVTLKNGDQVVIRDMQPDDKDDCLAFFRRLPAEDRKYLRRDVTRPDLIARRIREIDAGRVRRLVVVADGEIVADGALELEGHGWGENVAEIRLIVAREYQRKGLGRLLARELFFLAAQYRMDRIVARYMRPQTGARQILRRLGFHDEFVIPGHVRDQDGGWRDMMIMRCNLEDLWTEMEHMVADMDFQGRWPRPTTQ